MKYIVCTPDQKLAVFDEESAEFAAWGYDPSTDLDVLHERHFSGIGRRLFEAELALARQESSPLAQWQPGADKFATRWDRAVSVLVLYYDTEWALGVLSEMGFPGYVVPDWLVEARAAQDAAEEAEKLQRKAFFERPNPLVDSTKDEDVWNQIPSP